jgi:hypothetical protein
MFSLNNFLSVFTLLSAPIAPFLDKVILHDQLFNK